MTIEQANKISLDDGAAIPFWQSISDDVVAHVPPEMRNMSRLKWAWIIARIVLLSSGFHAILIYRLGYTCRYHLGGVGKLIAYLLFWFGRHWYNCAISPTARIYGGIILPHPQGIVIGPEVVVGPRTWIFQNVTIGGVPGKVGVPHIGSDSRIYTGAVVAGPVRVGCHVVMGANVVVSFDVPDQTIVRPSMASMSSL
jgi:serine O-acetyltransferase